MSREHEMAFSTRQEAVVGIMDKQRLDFIAKLAITSAGILDERHPIVLGQFQRLADDGLDALPVLVAFHLAVQASVTSGQYTLLV